MEDQNTQSMVLDMDIRAKALIYLNECGNSDKVPFIEELAVVLQTDEDTIQAWRANDKEFELFIQKLLQVQKVTLLIECSPEYLLATKHNMIKENHIVLKGLEEHGKIGVKITPGSAIRKFFEQILKGKDA